MLLLRDAQLQRKAMHYFRDSWLYLHFQPLEPKDANSYALQVEIGTPHEDLLDCGRLVFSVECSPVASSSFQVTSFSHRDWSPLCPQSLLPGLTQKYVLLSEYVYQLLILVILLHRAEVVMSWALS